MASSNLLYLLRNVWNQSFFIPRAPLTEHNLPDQTDRVFLITGGYTGVGEQVASILYSKNATVWIAGRSESKAATAIERLQSLHPNSSGKLHFLKVDFSDLTTIKPAVNDFLRRNEAGKLHWLDNNAGVMVPPKGSKGAQGHDLQFVTNIYGPFLFTKLLLPILRQTARIEKDEAVPRQRATTTPVRVSWAGSSGSFLSAPQYGVAWTSDGKELQGAYDNPAGAYTLTKAANWYLAIEFGRRFGDADGVLHNSYNPGNLATELQRTTKEQFGALAHSIIYNWISHPAIYGAYTEIYAGLSEEISLDNNDQGGWIVPWGRKSVMRPDMLAEAKRGGAAATGKGAQGDTPVGTRLWEWCEAVTRAYE